MLNKLKDYIPKIRERGDNAMSKLQRYLAGAGSGKAAENHITTFEGFAPVNEDERLCEAFDAMDGVIYLKETAVKEDNPPIKLKGN